MPSGRGKWDGTFNGDSGIKLLKLHGSLNWHKESDGTPVRESAEIQYDPAHNWIELGLIHDFEQRRRPFYSMYHHDMMFNPDYVNTYKLFHGDARDVLRAFEPDRIHSIYFTVGVVVDSCFTRCFARCLSGRMLS